MGVEQIQNPLHRGDSRIWIDRCGFEIVARPAEAHLLGDNAPSHRRLNSGSGHQDSRLGNGISVTPRHGLAPFDQLIAGRRGCIGVQARFGNMIQIDFRLQAHQIHRNHEDRVVVLRIPRGGHRKFAEIPNIEIGFANEIVQRNRYAVACQSGAFACGAPAEIRCSTGGGGSEDFGDVLLFGYELHPDLHALVGMCVVEVIDHLRPNFAVRGRQPAPMDDFGVGRSEYAGRAQVGRRHRRASGGGRSAQNSPPGKSVA